MGMPFYVTRFEIISNHIEASDARGSKPDSYTLYAFLRTARDTSSNLSYLHIETPLRSCNRIARGHSSRMNARSAGWLFREVSANTARGEF